MPIGCTRPIMMVIEADHADRHAGPRRSTHQAGVEALPFAPRGLADGAVALVELPHHAVGALDYPIETLCGHLLSMRRQRARWRLSSLAWFTPSARAI